MSWDILIQDLPQTARSVDDISPDFVPQPLGSRAELTKRIRSVVPSVDFSRPEWGVLEADTFSIEFNIGAAEVCDSIMLHVRGSGSVTSTLVRLLSALNLRAIDCQTGDFFQPEESDASFQAWSEYRNRVIQKIQNEK